MKSLQKIVIGGKTELFFPKNWNYFFQCAPEKACYAYVLVRKEENTIPLVFVTERAFEKEELEGLIIPKVKI